MRSRSPPALKHANRILCSQPHKAPTRRVNFASTLLRLRRPFVVIPSPRQRILPRLIPYALSTHQLSSERARTHNIMPSVASNASSGKRKRGSPKFYAVRVGRAPGIYHSWDDCKAQTDGTRAVYKSFPTLAEAESFMKGSSASSASASNPSNPSKTTKFYGVAIGHAPGVYTDYSSVQAQVKGFPGAKQKGFSSREEAQAYVNNFKRDSSASISLRGDLSETSSMVDKGSKGPDNKRQKKNGAHALTNGAVNGELGTGPLPPDAEDNFDPTIKLDPETGTIRRKTAEELSLTKSQPTGDFSGPINVYTDGSALGNGQRGALAGVGVYFGPRDPRNVSEGLRGDKQTNQRAELTAVARALDHIPIDRDCTIHTDSRYSINCLTEWFQKWEQNGWKSSSGKTVDNKDLIEPILTRIRERDMCRAKTKFVWVKGHSSDAGNAAADLLAVQGSRSSTPSFRNGVVTSATLLGRRSESVDESRGADGNGSEVKEDKDVAEFEKIFADLAAEQAVDGNGIDASADAKVEHTGATG